MYRATPLALRALVGELQPASALAGASGAAPGPGPAPVSAEVPWDIRQELGLADRVVMLSAPLVRPLSVPVQPSANFKPRGLWYSLGPAWLDYCREVLPHFEQALHYKLTLDRSRLLVINNDAELNAFTKEFAVPEQYPGSYGYYVDWRKVVASGVGGMEVAPYFGMAGGRRVTWAYTWDVPSGVVWDDSVILAAEEIPRQTPFVPVLKEEY